MFPHTLELSNGRKLHLPPVVPKEGSHGPIFTMSIRKSGSTMLTYLSSLLAKEAGYGFFDVGRLAVFKTTCLQTRCITKQLCVKF